ncbi:MAG: type II secretion system protein [Verrucomicrobiota bacterium]
MKQNHISKLPCHSKLGLFRSKLGFSMVEMLVVITIIAILAALSIPVIYSVQQKSIMAKDTQNLQQIGIAISLHEGENNMTMPNQHFPIRGTDIGDGDRWNFHEAVDRYLGDGHTHFNPVSTYNFKRRINSPFASRAAKGWEEYNKPDDHTFGVLAYSFNPNINNATHWAGKTVRIPRPSSIVIVGETNPSGGQMWPDRPVFEDNVMNRYRISRPGNRALYLFADYHIEPLEGDRSYDYYDSNPEETNIWRWW